MWNFITFARSMFSTTTYLIGLLMLVFSIWGLVMAAIAIIDAYGALIVVACTLIYLGGWLYYIMHANHDLEHRLLEPRIDPDQP